VAAASIAVRDLLCGPVTGGTVVGALRGAVYVLVGAGPGTAGRVVAVVARDAVRVPVAVVLPEHAQVAGLASVSVGSAAEVGGGVVRVGDRCWTVGRWFDPAVPALGPSVGPSAARLLAASASTASAHTASGETAHAEAALEGALRGRPCEAVSPAVEALVGRGEGLTPEGDDVLAGALAWLAAVGVVDERRASLVTAVEARLPTTSTVSAALLREALRGNVIPEVSNLLTALVRDVESARSVGFEGSGSTDHVLSTVRRAVRELLAVGHTSGAAMLRGLALAARATLAATELRATTGTVRSEGAA
jgi:hypothetical protein